ncbi:hypothetical protein pipiens_004868 [Culex pipiens pipiens]|uniref:Chymotrypsin-1 n=2 Tax=Culex pipiens TaxID=7175 RepID=A0A8D8K565_CULPI
MDNKLFAILFCALLGVVTVECIVGGQTALPNLAYEVVSIQSPTHICGGVLVKNAWVLTTASCVNDKTVGNLKVLVGSHRLLTNMERVTVTEKKMHPSYDTTTGINNVALLKLEKDVTSNRVNTVALNDAAITTGVTTVFYGWGSLTYGSSAKSNVLQSLYQKTLSVADCAEKVPGLPTGFICAQIQHGQAACAKDEGGPLINYIDGKLLGIYDHGTQCSGDAPDVFVDVFYFNAWITGNAV